LSHISIDQGSGLPLYRQLAESIRNAIRSGALGSGTRLPATRELAGQLGLNRTTVSAAYSLLEEAGLLEGQVGRGSFVSVNGRPEPVSAAAQASSFDWEALLPPIEGWSSPVAGIAINFSSSRPAREHFPMPEFRRLSKEVIDSAEAPEILQLGSPYGYAPLRNYLLEQNALTGVARVHDDLIVTNGCQQALDLLARVLVTENTPVLIEDPGYHGLQRVFGRAGANFIPIPSGGESGLNVQALEALVDQHRPRLLVVTPDFQNPTGLTLSLDQRKAILALARRHGVAVIESQIYRDLRYAGEALPSLKQLDETGNVISIGSYSKIAFPGLRVGWVIAPSPVIARLAEAKQTSDLHSDHLSQAVLLRFAESGELARHLKRTRQAGEERLRAVLESCAEHLPAGTWFSRPQGGMNLWIDLTAPLTADTLLRAAEERGVTFLPGPYFSVRRSHMRGLRISFGSLSPETIAHGIAILGSIAKEQFAGHQARARLEPVAAVV